MLSIKVNFATASDTMLYLKIIDLYLTKSHVS